MNTQEKSQKLNIKEKSTNSFLALIIRSGIIHLFQVISILLLARWLGPTDYGLFGIINSWIGFSYFFSDVGIAGALIQQKENPTPSQLKSCFAIQLIFSTIICIIFWMVARPLAEHHQIDNSGVWMIRILALGLPIYALRIIPKIYFERNVEFKPIAKIDLIESFIMYLVQIVLAYFNFGAWSFIIANLSRSIIGSILLIIKSPWYFFPKLSLRVLAPLINFGLPFQLNAIIPAVKALIVPLVLASLLPLKSVGIITWTISLASIPMIMAINYNQVLFPSLSRLQAHKEELVILASRGMELAILGLGLIFGLFAVCSEPGIDFFFPAKWSLAKQIFPLAILVQFLIILRYLCSAVLNATGRPSTRLFIEASTTALEFLLCWLAVVHFQEKGYFYAVILIATLSLLYTYLKIRFEIRSYTFKRILIIITICLFTYFYFSYFDLNINWLNIISRGLGFSFLYICLLGLIDYRSFADFKTVFTDIINRIKKQIQ